MNFQFIENISLLNILINIISQTFLFSIAASAIILLSSNWNIHLKTFAALCAVIIILVLPILLLLLPSSISPIIHLNIKTDDAFFLNSELIAASQNKTSSLQLNSPSKADHAIIDGNDNTQVYLPGKLIQLVLMLWLIVSFCKLLRIGMGLLKIHDYRKNSVCLNIKEIRCFNYRNNPFINNIDFPQLYISDSFFEPIAFGLLKPGILIPKKLYDNTTTKELEAVIMHELSHILNKDQYIGFLQRISLALYWWNPLIYYINKRFSRSREEMADIYAAANLGSAVYAKCLVNLAARLNGMKTVNCAIGFAAPHFKLNKRIRNILRGGNSMSLKPNKTKIVLLFMLVLSFALLSAFNRISVAQETDTQTAVITPENKSSEDLWTGAKKVTNAKMKPATLEMESGKHEVPPIAKKIAVILNNLEGIKQEGNKKEYNLAYDCLIGETGDVLDVRIDSINNKPISDNDELTKATLEWAKEFKYEPYVIEGKTAKVFITYRVKFLLNK